MTIYIYIYIYIYSISIPKPLDPIRYIGYFKEGGEREGWGRRGRRRSSLTT